MYASATITLSSNAQSNQGTVTCGQYDFRGSCGNCVPYFNLTVNPVVPRTFKKTTLWNYDEWTNIASAQLQALPGAVTWEARKGMYTVLKMSDEATRWHDAYDIPEHFITTGVTPPYV